ncbi:MAG: hypothetical protein K2X57_06180 [Xanthobacteraceae bacterium]|nr:hypothetical protein [Xanthobacteraceae bacterium]
MYELAINFSSEFVDNQYFKVLVVPQAVVAEVPRHLLAVFDRIGIRVELNANAVPVRDAVFHIEKNVCMIDARLDFAGTEATSE